MRTRMCYMFTGKCRRSVGIYRYTPWPSATAAVDQSVRRAGAYTRDYDGKSNK